MSRKYRFTREQVEEAVALSTSLRQVLLRLYENQCSGNYPTLNRKIKEWGISTAHFRMIIWNKGQSCDGRWGVERPLSEILVESSDFQSSRLRKRLLMVGLKKEECEVCGQGPVWNGGGLTLQLDHINGIHSDNRIENLRIICPNCHTQTSTFCSRNRKTRIDRHCKCGKKIGWKSKTCLPCQVGISRKTKIVWPEPAVLEEWLWREPAQKVAKQLGIGGSAIRKFCTKHGLKKPGRGYWQKKYGSQDVT